MNPYPSDKILKRMGFYSDQDGIVRRYINEGGNWNGHLNSTKEYIKKFIEKTGSGNIAVLGSGWMLDVPVEFLSENCKHVYLFDIRHPRQILHRYRHLKNISFINQDITGGMIEEVYSILQKRNGNEAEINNLHSIGFSSPEPLDSIISVNILNQLDILIIDYIKSNSTFKNITLDKFRTEIQESHIKSLTTNKSAIITDYEEVTLDNDDRILGSKSLLFTAFPEGKNRQEWIWKFDSQMTYYPNCKTNFKVLAEEL